MVEKVLAMAMAAEEFAIAVEVLANQSCHAVPHSTEAAGIYCHHPRIAARDSGTRCPGPVR